MQLISAFVYIIVMIILFVKGCITSDTTEIVMAIVMSIAGLLFMFGGTKEYRPN